MGNCWRRQWVKWRNAGPRGRPSPQGTGQGAHGPQAIAGQATGASGSTLWHFASSLRLLRIAFLADTLRWCLANSLAQSSEQVFSREFMRTRSLWIFFLQISHLLISCFVTIPCRQCPRGEGAPCPWGRAREGCLARREEWHAQRCRKNSIAQPPSGSSRRSNARAPAPYTRLARRIATVG